MADGGDDNDIFVYLGGEHEVPDGVVRAVIDPSVNTVRIDSFWNRGRLVSVIFHDGVLGRIKLLGVREIGPRAFQYCLSLSDVEFGDRLETVGYHAFDSCYPLRSIKIPSVRNIHSAGGI